MSKPQTRHKTAYDALVLGVATGEPVARFCERTGLARSTAKTWQNSPDFGRDVEHLRRQMLDRAVGKLAGAVETVAAGMIQLAEKAANEAVQLAAQRAVFSHLTELVEFSNFQDRLDELERKVEERHACAARSA